MRYVIGIDGGQTTTTAVLLDETGCLLGIGIGGPANHIHEPGGTARIQHSVRSALQESITMAELQHQPIAAACLGMTGASAHMEQLCRPLVPAERVLFGHDTRIALYASTFGRPGAVVIAGTGSAAFGRTAKGEEAVTGGWGYLMGDEGSAYWIAVQALNACCRYKDGRAEETQILAMLLEHLEMNDFQQVHTLVYSSMSRADIAALAELVSKAASQGDRTAMRILDSAGKELALLALKTLEKLNLQHSDVPLGTAGGVFRAGRNVLRPFRERLHKYAPEVRIVPPAVPAAAAAALMALEAIGIRLDESLLETLQTSLKQSGRVKT